jgi:UDP-N-acetylmuramyl pentapeptide phosphotransferase/UDP-N-acetylglucosamine-1-phosphate transferase
LIERVLLAAALVPPLVRVLCRRLKLIRRNFQGHQIPAAVGLTPLLLWILALALTGVTTISCGAAGFGILGLVDDLWGSRAVGGFRGHIGALLRGKPTTGSLKLVGGGLLALWMAGTQDRAAVWVAVDALLIALAANALNLLDLRPGRALAGFGLLSLPTLLTGRPDAALFLAPALLGAVIEYPADRRGRAMLGDTGSNLLGAAAGAAAVLALPPLGRLALLLVLFGLNLAAERVSLSAVIEGTPWLKAIDRRLGVR